MRLLERSTRGVRMTETGAELLEHAKRGAELSDAVDNIVSNQLSEVSGALRLSAPPSISDTLLAPIVSAFQAKYSDVRIHVRVTDRWVDHISEGVDLVFRRGPLKDLSARRAPRSDLSPPARGQSRLSFEVQAAGTPQRSAISSSAHLRALEAGQPLVFRARRRQRAGDAEFSNPNRR